MNLICFPRLRVFQRGVIWFAPFNVMNCRLNLFCRVCWSVGANKHEQIWLLCNACWKVCQSLHKWPNSRTALWNTLPRPQSASQLLHGLHLQSTGGISGHGFSSHDWVLFPEHGRPPSWAWISAYLVRIPGPQVELQGPQALQTQLWWSGKWEKLDEWIVIAVQCVI